MFPSPLYTHTLPEKDILNSRIIILEIQPRKFFLATRILFLRQDFFFLEEEYFSTHLKVLLQDFFLKFSRRNSCSKKKIPVPRIKFLLQEQNSCCKKKILGCILSIVILKLHNVTKFGSCLPPSTKSNFLGSLGLK